MKHWALLGAVALIVGCTSAPEARGVSTGTVTPSASAVAPTATDCPPEDELPVLTATPTPTPTPTATPTEPSPTSVAETATPEPTPPASWLGLQEDLNALVNGYAIPGEYAVAVTDLQTGDTISVNGDRPQLAGCVMNLFVLMAATHEVEGGHLDESAVSGLIASTTWSSNATTAKEIVLILGEGDGVAGTQRVADYVASLGLQADVVLDHPPLYASYTIGRDPNNWVTAEAMNRALVLLWEGEALAEPWRDFLLDNLEAVKPGLNYLVASVPAQVSHKNGFFRASNGYVDNDTGIVRFTAGDREYAYAVTLLFQHIDVKYADVPLGQELMRTVHAYFTATYQ